IRLDDDAEHLQLRVRIHVTVMAGHVEVRLDEIAARVVPVDARHFDDAHAAEPMRASRADRRDVAAADAGIADAGTVDLDARLDDVAHRPDADGFAGRGDLEISGDNARVFAHGGERGVLVDGQATVRPARMR